jgi:chloramphenicol 3-O phosphotransferase
MATAVVLNGTSSSGKTTIARALQELAPRRFLNFSIDSILYTLPPRDLDRIMSGGDLGDLRIPELVRAFYSCARQLLELGHDLVLDHAVTARYHAELLLEATAGHEVLLIGLECPTEVLRSRERARGDRREGMAELQQRTIHSWLEYDLLLDSAALTPEEAAARIVEALRTRGLSAED